jgi:hypothetical protein
LIRGGKYIVSAIFEDMDHEFQEGESSHISIHKLQMGG